MDCEALLEWFGEENSQGMEIFETDKERLLEMIEAWEKSHYMQSEKKLENKSGEISHPSTAKLDVLQVIRSDHRHK